jgi:hypothetical protein
MTTKKHSVTANSPAPPANIKPAKQRSKSGSTIPPGGKLKKSTPAMMKKEIRNWSPGHSPFFRG